MAKTTAKEDVRTTGRQTLTSPISDLLSVATQFSNMLRAAPSDPMGCDPTWALRMFHFYGFQTNTVHGGAIRLNPKMNDKTSQEIFFSGVSDKYPIQVKVCASVTNLGPGRMLVRWDSGSRELACNQTETFNIVTSCIVVAMRKDNCMGMYSVTCEAPVEQPQKAGPITHR